MQGINGEVLYDRDDTVKELVSLLLNGTGARVTPFMDACFGAGKTSIMVKLKPLLADLKDRWRYHPDNIDELLQACYLHVVLKDVEFSSELDIHDANVYDRIICNYLAAALSLSASHHSSATSLDCSTRTAFFASLGMVCGGKKFIVHFDDVGHFEKFGPIVGRNVIYRIWKLGDALKDRGHFFVISGRSTQLRSIGLEAKTLGDFSSPNLAKMVSLPQLKRTSVVNILKDANLLDFLAEDEVEFIWDLCSGVPRAVSAAVRHLRSAEAFDRVAVKEAVVSFTMQDENLHTVADKNLLKICYELAWCEISFPETAELACEPISAVVARLNIHIAKGEVASSREMRLVFPGYRRDASLISASSVLAIARSDNPGSRFEHACCRVYHLRFSMLPKSWSEAGLPFLESENVPFPNIPYTNVFCFPKMQAPKDEETTVAKALQSEKDVVKFMTAVHEVSDQSLVVHNSADRFSTAFPRSLLPTVWKEMRVGQYYKALNMSSSPDVMVRVSDSAVVGFQLKNVMHPFAESKVIEESKKMMVDSPEWTKYLVFICANGHSISGAGESDIRLQCGDVQCLVLSRASVQRFFGKKALDSISDSSLLADSLSHMLVSPSSSRPSVQSNEAER